MVSRASLIEELESAIASGSDQKRVDTLRRATDLFAHVAEQLSEEQITVFDDVIGRLAEDIELKARAELSRRLAVIPNAPIDVVKALARAEEIDVAGPILAESARLDEQELLETAKLRGQGHLLAISKRQELSESVTDVLVARGDRQVVRSVAGNEGARFSATGFGVLVKRSEGDDLLTERVGLRQDLPPRHLQALLLKASEQVLKRLTAVGSGTHPHIQKVLTDIAAQMKERAAPPPRDYTAAKRIVEALKATGMLDDGAVQAFARNGKFEETAVVLSMLCRLPIDEIEHAMLREGLEADLILIIARAAGLTWPTTKTVLLMPTTGHGTAPQDLDTAQRNFERLQVATARRVVRFHQVRHAADKANDAAP